MRHIQGVEVYDSLAEMAAASHTAVLSVDIQNDFCHPEGHFGLHGKDLSQFTMPGSHADSPAWLRFKTRDGKDPNYTVPGTFGWNFVDGLEPGPNDTVIEKTRPDAFLNTHLERVLRARGIETVVVLGVNTEGCVESTVRSASYRDYYTVVVGDALGSPNRERHEASLGLYRARYPLHTAAEILAVWRGRCGSDKK